jgi:acetyl/propionyl-CoA carboxylase alpha subunit
MKIAGIHTNTGFFREVLAHEDFQTGNLSTGFLDRFFESRKPRPEPDLEIEAVAAVVAALQLQKASRKGLSHENHTKSAWLASGREELLR